MYLSATKIGSMEGVRRVHQLNPAAIRLDKSLGDEVGLNNIGIHLITIAPGDKSTEFHTHKYEEEAIYVLSGHGTEILGDTSHRIGPGDFIGFPAGGAARRLRSAGITRARAESAGRDSHARGDGRHVRRPRTRWRAPGPRRVPLLHG